MKEFIKLLEQHFNKKIKANRNLSIRSLCLKYNISTGQYSDWISGRRNIKLKTAETILQKLDLNYEEKELFRLHLNKNAKLILKKLNPQALNFASDSHCMALLVLLSHHQEGLEIDDIFKEIDLSSKKLMSVINTLLSLNLITKNENKFFCLPDNFDLIPDGTSETIQLGHKKTFLRMAKRISSIPLQDREVMSSVVYLDPDLIPELKKRIKTFIIKNSKFSESVKKGKKRKLYEINLQLFPYK